MICLNAWYAIIRVDAWLLCRERERERERESERERKRAREKERKREREREIRSKRATEKFPNCFVGVDWLLCCFFFFGTFHFWQTSCF